jgi:hypothetical protein
VDSERFTRSGENKKYSLAAEESIFLNVQHRTSNDELARAAQALAPRVARPFYKKFSMPYSKFDVGRWMFDVPILFVLTATSLI